jgi:carboxymethylenebutenolidase
MRGSSAGLRGECAVTREEKVFSVGFCLDGSLGALLACSGAELAGCVVFYGSPPPADLISQIRCPVLLFAGDLDPRIAPLIPAFEQSMKDAGKRLRSTVYPGVGHAFFNDERPTYDVRAARDARAQTLTLFCAELS